MARLYKVSADTSEKEKAVGGIMTFGQAGWLVLGFVISAGLFMLFAVIFPAVLALIFAIPPGAIFGCIFAFYKKGGLPLFTYIRYKRKFEKKTKYLINDLVYDKNISEEDELFQ